MTDSIDTTIDYIDTVTELELEGEVVTVETKFVELINLEVPGIQGPKGDALTLNVSSSSELFTEIDSIEVGENLELTQPEPNKVLITGLPAGIDFYTHEMNGLASTFTAEHNLGRFIAVARVYQPDGEVAQVEVRNKDNAGNISQNVAQVISSVPMLGTLTLI